MIENPPRELEVIVDLIDNKVIDIHSSSPFLNVAGLLGEDACRILSCGSETVTYINTVYKRASDESFVREGRAIRRLSYKLVT